MRCFKSLAAVWQLWVVGSMMALAPGAHAALMNKFLGRSTIYISGRIELGDAEKFAAMLDDRVQRVVMTSDGGSDTVAMKIGRLMRQHGLAVHVRDHCLGACARYVFPSGVNNTIADGGIVALQASTLALLELAVADLKAALPLGQAEAEQRDNEVRKYSELLVHHAADEQQYKQQMGFNADVMARYEAILRPLSGDAGNIAGSRLTLQNLKSHCRAWVPDRQGWQALGVNVVSDFVRADVQAVAKKLDVPAAAISFATLPLPEADGMWCEQQKAIAAQPAAN